MSSVSQAPQRAIYNDDDLQSFLQSPAKESLLLLISGMGKSCASSTTVSYKYNPTSPLIGLSPPIASLHGSLLSMLNWIEDYPPIIDKSKVRFGNPSFKLWHKRLTERSISIVYNILKHRQDKATITSSSSNNDNDNDNDFDIATLQAASDTGYNAAEVSKSLDSIMNKNNSNNDNDNDNNNNLRDEIQEIVAYLHQSFGHEVRLDYGTGHECSFQVFLLALAKLGCFGCTVDDVPSLSRLKSITISIWTAYLRVTRQIQQLYMLEPAGSHGVWGLDDYHCLPFFYGACQMQSLIDNSNEYEPSIIHNDTIVQRDGDTLLYLGCIRYIKQLKKNVPFFESSPMLNDISRLPTWTKVTSGLLRLFEGEVLSKRQVVQHFVFGTLFDANWTPSQQQHPSLLVPSETFRDTSTSTSTVDNNNNEKASVASAAASKGTAIPGEYTTKAPWAK